MRYTIPVALLFLPLEGVRAQTSFNVVREHPSILSYTGASSVNELPDGYLMFSYGWSLDSAVGAVQVSKFDLEGNFQWEKEHRRERNVFPGYIDPIARISDTSFVAGMTEVGGTEPNITFLYWFNAEGDTIRTRFLKSDSNATNGNHGTRQLLALFDGGFLHCGWCANTTPGQGGCITRLDSTGTFLWERIYPQAEYIRNAREAPDGGFVLGGSRNAAQDEAVVIRTDSAGNVQWVRYHGLYAVAGGNQALIDENGNVLMAGNWTDLPPPQMENAWACMYKYAPDGTMEPRRDYFFEHDAVAVHILPKENDHYWLIGGANQYALNPDGRTLLWELNENLDSLWMRKYWYYAANGSFSAPYSVRATSDGGLVMCGVTRQGETDPLPYKRDNWLIKLDSYGCLVPGCQNVGIDEVALGLNEYLHIAPNPVAQGQPLHVVFEPPAGFIAKGPLRVVLLDALGRQVHEERVQHGIGQLAPLPLATGLYYLHLTDGTRWLAGGKIIVE